MNEWVALGITAVSCVLTYIGATRAVRVAQREADTSERDADTHQAAMVSEAAVALLAPYRSELAARDYRIAELEARVRHLERILVEAGLDLPPAYRQEAP